MNKRIISMLLVLVMVLGMLPATVFATVEGSSLGQVRVIVENTTYSVEDGAPWDGTLLDTMVDLTEDMTMMSAIYTALTAADIESEGADIGGDGADTSDTSLTALSVNSGELNESFTSNHLAYTVTVPEGTEAVSIHATAANKQNQVYLFVGETEYRRTASVPVADGTVISVRCGNGEGATIYTLTIDVAAEESGIPETSVPETTVPVTYTVTLPAEPVGYTVEAAEGSVSPVAEGGSYTFTVVIAEGYEAGENFVVKANETALTDVDGVYTIGNITADQTVSVEGVVESSTDIGDACAVTFNGHSAQVDNFKVYTYTGGVKGETDLLEGVADSDTSNTQTYTTALPAGDYWVEGYDAGGDCSGGVLLTVTADGDNTFTINRVYGIKASNSGWVLGTDYTVSAQVTAADMTVRVVEMGTADYNGSQLPAVLCLYGDTVKVTYTPSEARAAENYIETFKSQTLTASSSSFSVSVPQAVAVTFAAPAGSVVSAGYRDGSNYYSYVFATAKSVVTEGDTVSYTYMVPKNTQWFYRVRHERGVTYWNWNKWSEDTTVEITAEDLYIGSSDFTSDTIYRYDVNVYDRADIYLNINGKGHLNMDVGESYQLNVFRNWQAIENYMNSKIALPDMRYTVIDVNGNESDLLTIIPDANNSSVATMTANGEGTAIVLVTYDAMTHAAGQGGSQFSAIWPECTGVFIVTVGADEAEIDTGMMMDRFGDTETAIDAEHDVLFYLGEAGADFTFAPESGTTVTVARAGLTTKSLTYNGFTSDGVTVNEDGTVTVSGLTSGRHIIKVERTARLSIRWSPPVASAMRPRSS